MKTNLMKPFTTLLSILLLPLYLYINFTLGNNLSFATDLYMPLVTICEGFNPSDLDNDYWKIEEIKTNTWHVLFRNVNIKYEIIQCPSDTDTTTSHFEFREIGPKYTGIHNGDSLLKLTSKEVFEYWSKNNQGYIYLNDGTGGVALVGSADRSYVFLTDEHINIVDATLTHFNNIQRGNFHPNVPNLINPNSHGRRTDVLSYVKNSFGINSNWPTRTRSNSPIIDQSIYGRGGQRASGASGAGEAGEPCQPSHLIDREIRSPLDQFLIMDLFMMMIPLLDSLYLSFTNIILYLIISSLIVINTYILSVYPIRILVTKWYTAVKSIYQTVYNLVKSQIQSLKGINLLPFFFCLFIYILITNLIGMIPYSFAPTSHFILTFFVSFTIVLGCTVLGFILHKLNYFSLLAPKGCPFMLLYLLVLIETVSYLARSVSLGLRLAANILSGHMLLNILSEFTYKIMDTNIIYFFIGIIPLIFIAAFSGLELGIGFIQSQVFVVLSSSYTKDSIELH